VRPYRLPRGLSPQKKGPRTVFRTYPVRISAEIPTILTDFSSLNSLASHNTCQLIFRRPRPLPSNFFPILFPVLYHPTTNSTGPRPNARLLRASLNNAKALTVFWQVTTCIMVDRYHVSEWHTAYIVTVGTATDQTTRCHKDEEKNMNHQRCETAKIHTITGLDLRLLQLRIIR
jgi:hypothetical protein